MIDLTFQQVLKNIKNNKTFTYARYGDGEWNAILGEKGQNCDQHKYFPEMGSRLKSIIDKKPKYYIGLQSIANNIYAGRHIEFDRLVAKNKWCSTEIFTEASIAGTFNQFFEALVQKNIIFVGNWHTFKNLLQITSTPITIPEIDCWNNYEKILSELAAKIREYKFDNLIILYSASMMTNVLIDDIYGAYGNALTQIDMGSVFDPYVGRKTRTYHKTLNI